MVMLSKSLREMDEECDRISGENFAATEEFINDMMESDMSGDMKVRYIWGCLYSDCIYMDGSEEKAMRSFNMAADQWHAEA